jgi:hypothetical protein
MGNYLWRMTSLELFSRIWIMEKKSLLVTPRSEGVTYNFYHFGPQKYCVHTKLSIPIRDLL